LQVSKLEKSIGIEVYSTSSLGIGGTIRQRPSDFIVQEVLADSSKAEVSQSAEHQVLGSSLNINRYLLCVLVKRNWDTFSAVKAVADQIGVRMNRIQIGGIKDAKAVTAQHITIEDATIADAQKVNIKDIEIRPIGYVRNKLSPYFLLGNQFQIIIKTISHPKATIKKRVEETIKELEAKGGIPNFFGHQRFGTARPITHLVGKAIVKGDFRRAAMLFLAKSSLHEHQQSRIARQELHNTQDFKHASKNFPKQLRYERLMLAHLAQKPDDFIGAFRRLPNKLLELFPQAYQSYLFNKFLSKRIQNGISLGKAEVGDHVVNVERTGLPMPKMHRTADAQKLADINIAVKAGKMRIAIPLIGFKQQFSQGKQGEIEKQIMEEEGLNPQNFRISEMPTISPRGELRTILTPLNDFSLVKISKDSTNSSKSNADVSFMLYRGSYATIFIREIVKPCNPIKSGF